VIEFTGFLAIDPILGMAFGVVLLWASVGVIKEAVHILMEGTPEGTDLDAVTADLNGQDGVLDVHHVHAWTLTSGKHAFSAHIRHGEPAEAADLLNRAYRRLTEQHGFHMVTLQLETECLDERHARDLDIVQIAAAKAAVALPFNLRRDALGPFKMLGSCRFKEWRFWVQQACHIGRSFGFRRDVSGSIREITVQHCSAHFQQIMRAGS